jgi:hypothetical protein
LARAHLITATALKNLWFYQYVEFLRGRPARGQLTSLFLDADAEPKFDAVIDSVIGQGV